jgi:hypothetical protein
MTDDARSVLILAMGQDTAGQGIRIKQGFDRYRPGWTVRSVHSTPTYIRYPSDMAFDRRRVRELYDAADVVHLRNNLAGYEAFDQGRGKPVVVHHHGSLFRARHRAIAASCRRVGAIQLVSTVDLLTHEPDTRWLPAPYELSELAKIAADARRPDDGKIRIAHAPTDRAIKGTDHFLAAVERIAQRYPVEAVLIERKPWRECLRLKATADIYYDQMILGYGCNTIEAWGLGLPVVAGAESPVVRARMVKEWGRFPFVSATPRTLEARLTELVRSVELRREWAAIGLEHAQRFHAAEKVVDVLADVYASAPRTRGHMGGLTRRGIAGSRMAARG